MLRLAGPDIETRSDEYGRLDGQTFPNYGETPDELADRAGRYGDAIAVYGVGQSIAARQPGAPTTPAMGSRSTSSPASRMPPPG